MKILQNCEIESPEVYSKVIEELLQKQYSPRGFSNESEPRQVFFMSGSVLKHFAKMKSVNYS